MAIAQWKLGRRPIEDMPAAAVDALVAGLDSPSLAVLAGLEGASWSELAPIVERVLAELGGPPNEREAKRLVADEWLGRVADGRLDPGAYDDWILAEEILWDLGGDYEWFRLAIHDLEVLEALEDRAALEQAVAEVRRRASAVLRRPVAERFAAAAPSRQERPFLARVLDDPPERPHDPQHQSAGEPGEGAGPADPPQ